MGKIIKKMNCKHLTFQVAKKLGISEFISSNSSCVKLTTMKAYQLITRFQKPELVINFNSERNPI